MFPRSLYLLILLALCTLTSAAPITHDELVANAAKGLRLLSLEEGAEPVWKTEDEKLELLRSNVHFFDVTEVYERKQNYSSAKKVLASFPAPSHQDVVSSIVDTLSIDNMESDLSELTAFNNRYYTSSTGAQAADWIRNTVSDLTSSRDDVTVEEFTHRWAQSSTILRFAGADTSAPVTILGAHMDSINLRSPSTGRAPGADDDGTGTVNLIETVRALVNAGYEPATPLEFHWYAAEEVGLLGSQDIASQYESDGVQVKAFMELDMSGYFAPGTQEVMALQADYIDEGLNDFLGQLIDEYANIPWTMDIACGYACSDHASWYEAGYPTSFPYEAVTGDDNPSTHSASDTTSVNGFSWEHSLEFTKIGVAFAIELTA